MVIHVKADKDEEAQEVLRELTPAVLDGILKLEKLYPEIKLPDKLILQCIKQHTKTPKTLTCALTGYKPQEGWYMKFRRSINGNFGKRETVLHEVAHLGEAMLTGKWNHGKVWKKIFEQLKNCQGTFELTDVISSFIVAISLLILILKIFVKLS